MKRYLAQFYILFLTLVAHFPANAQQCTWARTGICRGGSSPTSQVTSVSKDRFGNAYVAGGLNGDSMTLGATVVHNTGTAGSDIFAAKYDSLGGLVWVRAFGGGYFDACNHAVADSIGNFYLFGNFENTITFGASTFTSVSYVDLFLTKLDPSGNVIWARHFSGSAAATASNPEAWGITVDKNGNVIIAGYSSDTLTFDSTHKITRMFLAKYDQSGNLQWVTRADADQPRHIAADNFGNIFVTGTFRADTVYFDSISLIGSYATNTGFVTKYNTYGRALWAKSAASDWTDNINIASDFQGNIFVCGRYYGAVLTIGSTTFTNPDTSHEDIFTSKYDSSGNILWVRDASGHGPGDGCPFGIATDQSGNVIVSGRCDSGTITFGATSFTKTSCFIVKYTSAGVMSSLWRPDTGYLEPIALAIDKRNNLFVGGDTGGSLLIMDTVTVAFVPPTSFTMILAKFNGVALGVEENYPTLQDVNIYPNPTDNVLNIAAGSPIKSVIIFNNIGQIVFDGSFASETVQIDISGLMPGNYTARINNSIIRRFTKF